MPAYRSAAEGEIREAVVKRLREMRPGARIIHEINASHFGNRIDVLAVDRAEMIAVEIKSEKDKLDRLPAQIEAMNGVANYSIAALHEKFLVEQKTNQWAAHREQDGVYYLSHPPKVASGANEIWVYPERWRAMLSAPEGWDHISTWDGFPRRECQPLPDAAIHMLWRDELYELCGRLRLSVGKRARMPEMLRDLRWLCTGKELTLGICAALRARDCIEADPPVVEEKTDA